MGKARVAIWFMRIITLLAKSPLTLQVRNGKGHKATRLSGLVMGLL